MNVYTAPIVSGHKDLKLAAHYSKIDGEVQKETSLKILDHIQRLGFAENKNLLQKNVQDFSKIEAAVLDDNVVPFRKVNRG